MEENQKTEPEALLEAQAQAVFRETGTGERNMSRQENMEMKKNTEVENKETELPQAEVSQPLAGEKRRQFQEIMNQVIGRAIEENSEKLSQDVSGSSSGCARAVSIFPVPCKEKEIWTEWE